MPVPLCFGEYMKYIDSNVFIYPILYEGKKAKKAKNLSCIDMLRQL